jgi:hypothetical protein
MIISQKLWVFIHMFSLWYASMIVSGNIFTIPSYSASDSSTARFNPQYRYNAIHEVTTGRNRSQSKNVGIVIVYSGVSWPNWFPLFLITAQSSQRLYDWLFILPIENSPPPIDVPNNVRIFKLPMHDLVERLISIDNGYVRHPSNREQQDMKGRVINIISGLISSSPYMLVEFKPCFGYIFYDILSQYARWAYADIDMLIGRMDKLIDVDALNKYDIVGVSFGDPYIFYLRGQLVIHRNRPDINLLWRKCDHFTSIYNRSIAYEDMGSLKWSFVSVEGCYSYAVLRQSNVSVFISTSQLSDAFSVRIDFRESYMLGKSVVQCNNLPIYEADLGRIRSFMLEDSYTGNKSSQAFYTDRSFTPVKMKKYKCIYRYWFDKRYEVTLIGICIYLFQYIIL